ncbi:MAG: hypothetical protein WC843_04180 [Candidatus Gracilibacteria bacterium]|jgi:hypothetical protein
MNKTIKNVLLWVAVLPASLVSMMLSFGLWRILHNLTAARYIDTNSWLNIFFIEIMSNLIAGAVFVFIGYKIAPNNQKNTAIVLTALLLLVGGSSLFIVNFMSKEYFSNTGIIAGLFGSIACCISIYKGEFDKKE